MSDKPKIKYTRTDEAPALATYSFLPVVNAFTNPADIDVEPADISLAARILAQFPDRLTDEQKVPDTLANLGELVKKPEANVIKLPNISASVPQLKAAIAELQEKGFDLPDYPDEPQNDEEQDIHDRYGVAKGSAVNPVLREGNSDRRAPKAVKEYAKRNPHSMGDWSSDTQSHVATMREGDFRSNEKSVTVDKATSVRIEHVSEDGDVTVLKPDFDLLDGEVIDSSVLEKQKLLGFLDQQIRSARESGVLFSLHMKATMMKVSDPIIFGHAVRLYFKDLFLKHAETFEELGVDPNNGFGDVLKKLGELDDEKRTEIENDIKVAYERGPDLAMVNSDEGITNLHVPSDVIIDASMPAMIRTSGCMWNKHGKTQETKAVIPDSSYADLYIEVFEDCKKHGAYDPTTMGTVQNVGLMAKKAEEYGSHDKTFEISGEGHVRVVDADDNTLLEHEVHEGDIWRMCQTKDAPIKDWIGLAVRRAKATGFPVVFWLDKTRAHDAELIKKLDAYLPEFDTDGLTLEVMNVRDATRYSVEQVRKSENVISATGNVLRDYLTDLFPILEVGTSAKMLSIVPLMNGGGLFETGAGGSAPKHVQQMQKEGHLRWDSLGEYLALAESFQHIADHYDHAKAQILADTLGDATTKYLLNNKSPSRKVNEPDNRHSTYYLATYWAQELAGQDADADLKSTFEEVADKLSSNEEAIVRELLEAQGEPVDLGGYYLPEPERCEEEMRPSSTLNEIIDSI